ncbi:TetR/AcrR family transcriptional regulator [Paenibacillus rigui]|uniref:TetR family transcriptional regulator n=1 Tax=Paenibacillus rigui TaxID=554312 RepID=A0A229UIK6_9BACL|nr:TetR/AcrR family transcriptional regulator [Paenibacillus rigui]OXM83278.1 TetR family transcriptional regulator [Paenibacillus rigui]
MYEARTKRRIVDYATKKFFTFGFSKISTDQMANDLGMSKATLYKYFPKKEALLEEVISHFALEQMRDIERIASDPELEFKQKIERFMFVSGKRLSTVRKEAVQDIQRSVPEMYERLMEFRKSVILKKLSELFQQGVQKGLFRKDIDQTFVASVILAAVESLTDPEHLSHSTYTYETVFQNILILILEGNMVQERDDAE